MAQPIKTNKSKLKLTVSRIRDQTYEVEGLFFTVANSASAIEQQSQFKKLL